MEALEERQLLAAVPVSEINLAEDAQPTDLLADDEAVYFTAKIDDGSRQLFVTDGSRSSTRQITEGLWVDVLHKHGDDVFFYNYLTEVWKTDGGQPELVSGEGGNLVFWNDKTVVLTVTTMTVFGPDDQTTTIDISGIEDPGTIRAYTSDADIFYFVQNGASSSEIWMSDGTQEGTQVVDSFEGDLGVTFPIGDKFGYTVRVGETDAGWIGEYFLTDGTAVESITTFSGTSENQWSIGLFSQFYAFDDVVLFPTGDQVWETDGSAAGTRLFADEPVNPIWRDGDATYFVHSGRSSVLYKNEGTTEPLPLFTIDEESYWDRALEHNGTLYFATRDGSILESDGTPEGTSKLDLGVKYSGYSVFPNSPLVVHKGSLFFAGMEGESESRIYRYTLEPRWTNPFEGGDVNDDGVVSPVDALLVMNELNNREYVDVNGAIMQDPVTDLQLDVNNDQHISPSDALLAINQLSSTARAASSATSISGSLNPVPMPTVSAGLPASEKSAAFLATDLDDDERADHRDAKSQASLVEIVFGEQAS